jgi:dihydroflavonol-4-reductase
MIVVTGGTGLVGAHLLLELLKGDDKVRAIIREDTNPEKALRIWRHYVKDPENLLEKTEWFRCDICDKVSLYEALQGADQVYHCAAKVTFDGRDRRKMFEVNALGTQNIVNICIEQKNIKLVHVSSIAAIGKSVNGTSLMETDGWPVKSKSVYAQTKTIAELEVWRGIAEGLNAVIVNPAVIIGPGDWQQSSSRFFDIVYRGLKYYTKGITGFVDVQDVTKAMIRLMNEEISGERFILISENMSIRDFFQKIALSLGVLAPSRYASPGLTSLAWRFEYLRSFFTGIPPAITRQSARASHGAKYYSSAKIIELLNFSFTPMEKCIAQTAKFYLKEKRNEP